MFQQAVLFLATRLKLNVTQNACTIKCFSVLILEAAQNVYCKPVLIYISF